MKLKRDYECRIDETEPVRVPPADCCRTLELASHQGSETISVGVCVCGGRVTQSLSVRWYSTPRGVLYATEVTA